MKQKAKFSLKRGFYEICIAFSEKKTLNIFIVAFFWYLSSNVFLLWISPYYIHVHQASQLSLTLFLFVIGITWTLGSCVLNVWLLRYIETPKLFILSTSLVVVLMLIIPLFPSVRMLYVISSIQCLFSSVSWSNLSNAVSLIGKGSEYGKLMGINQSMLAFSEVVAPIIGGLFVYFHYSSIFYISGILAFLALVLMYYEKKRFLKKH